MRTKTLHVTLDTAASPPVSVAEDTQAVGKHRYQLQWVPADGQSGWAFSKITQPDQVTPLPDPPFSTPSVADAMITVEDDNKHSGHGTYHYSICVTKDGTPYWSDPEIINRGGN